MGTSRKKLLVRPAAGHLGRPSKYRPEFCEQLVAHMAQGLSFDSFAALAGVTHPTLYNWLELQPDFLYAKNRGTTFCRLWWERLGQQGVQGLGPECVVKRTVDAKGREVVEYGAAKFNPGTWIFNMINRFPGEWSQRTQVDVDLTVTTPAELAFRQLKQVNPPGGNGAHA